MMLNHLLHLQLNHRSILSIRVDVALHKGAVEAPRDPRIRIDVVFHAGDFLAGVVVVSVRDGVHVVSERVHDARLGGADAHDFAAFAVQAHCQLRVGEGLVLGLEEVEAASGAVVVRGVVCGWGEGGS